MGMSPAAAGRKGGRRRRGVPRYGAMAEINMTPFIDVMLVLLIIFMVAAPLLATGVAVDLPQTKAGPLNIDQKPVSIAIDDKGQIFLMDQPLDIAQLLDRLKETAKQGFDERIYVRGSKAVNYGRVAEVMSLVTSAGYKKVALVTEQDRDRK
jgi:biopolymer transport protein TolR